MPIRPLMPMLVSVVLAAGCSMSSNDAGNGGEAPAPAPPPPAAEAPVATSPAAAASGATANSDVDATGALRLVVGDATIDLQSAGCTVDGDVRRCDDAEVTVTDADGVPRSARVSTLTIDPRTTAYRGRLASPVDQAGRSIVLADIDADGRKDLALRTGSLGGYGSASYDVFIADDSGFRPSPALSALTHGALGLFTLEDGHLVRRSKSGCCLHTTERYAVGADGPELVEEVIEDSTGNRAVPDVSIRRRIDGEMRAVDAADRGI